MQTTRLSHRQMWAAIDALATQFGLSPSGLAKNAGLDPTSFNKSKRMSAEGKLRWPGTESLAKILDATGATFEEFAGLAQHGLDRSRRRRNIPVIGLAEAGSKGFFDDAGFPAGTGWDEVAFPDIGDDNAYALEVSGDSMAPMYRQGDTLIVSPNASIRRRDRVIVKTRTGEVMAKILVRKTVNRIELASLNPDYEDRSLDMRDVAWIARIIWASQ